MEHKTCGNCNYILLAAIISVVSFIDEFDASVVEIALPSIATWFGIGAGSTSMVVLAYIVGIAAFLFLFGKISANGYVRSVMTWGLIVFAIFSVLCAVSTDMTMLALVRFAQGIGASMMAAATPILVVHYMPANRQGSGISLMAAATGAGLVAGPSLGGFICDILSWHYIFVVNVPICVAVVMMVLKGIPKEKPKISPKKLDVLSSAYLSVFTVLSLLLLQSLVDDSIPGYLSLPLLAVLVACLVLLVRRIRDPNVAEPVLNVAVFKNRDVVLLAISFLLTTVIATGTTCILPYYFEGSLGTSSATSGLYLTFACLATIVVSLPTGRICDRIGCKKPTSFAVFLRIVFSVMFALIIPEWGFVPLFAALIIMGVSFGTSGTSQPTRMIHHAKPEVKEETTSFMILMNYIGTSLGVAVYTLLFVCASPESKHIPFAELSEEVITSGLHLAAMGGVVMAIVAFILTVIVKNVLPPKDDAERQTEKDTEP